MATTIYEVSAYLAGVCVDGRSLRGVWGNEKQFHPDRAAADSALARLSAGGYWGCPVAPTYEVQEVTRERYPGDDLGEQEWRTACRQAGVDPIDHAEAGTA